MIIELVPVRKGDGEFLERQEISSPRRNSLALLHGDVGFRHFCVFSGYSKVCCIQSNRSLLQQEKINCKVAFGLTGIVILTEIA